MGQSPFSAVCKVEAVGEEVEVECLSCPEQCGGSERGECMVAQHEMWRSIAAQL